jgi:hypothetical protein
MFSADQAAITPNLLSGLLRLSGREIIAGVRFTEGIEVIPRRAA